MSYPAISLTTATVGPHRRPQKRLQTARLPPIYPNSSPDHRACNFLTPFRCPHAVHPCPSVDSGLKGAETLNYLATSPEVEGVTGKFFVDCQTVPSSALSYDAGLASDLWELSERLTEPAARVGEDWQRLPI